MQQTEVIGVLSCKNAPARFKVAQNTGIFIMVNGSGKSVMFGQGLIMRGEEGCWFSQEGSPPKKKFTEDLEGGLLNKFLNKN